MASHSFVSQHTHIKALLLHEKGHPIKNFKVGDAAKPDPTKVHRKDSVLIRVVSTALNPVDWKMAQIGFFIESVPVVLGCDVAGIVEEVGPKVTRFKKGDAVFAFTLLGVEGYGTFAEYCLAPETHTFHKPASLSFDQAATLSVGVLTAALGLYGQFKFNLPSKRASDGEQVLIWGGASSVGQYAVQLAALSGYSVIATASKRNHDLLRELGAKHVVDYNDADALDQIKKITGGKLRYAFDVISTETADKCVGLLTTSEPAHIATIAGDPTKDKLPSNVTSHPVFLGGNVDEALLQSFVLELEPLVNDGKLKPNQVETISGGIETGILEGLQRMVDNKVSAKKLVVPIASP